MSILDPKINNRFKDAYDKIEKAEIRESILEPAPQKASEEFNSQMEIHDREQVRFNAKSPLTNSKKKMTKIDQI